MSTPVLHLVCNAHLDPVWQWRWEEGAAEAVTTFSIAARLLREFPEFVFNHNEAILYRWVEELDPRLFEEIRTLVREGRWIITGGWDLQPDVNMPGTEALIRHIAHGRLYFREKFGVAPLVAYNFDSFGHTGGLPQLLVQAGYKMYVHMRPWAKDLKLPADLYRWRGVDGTEIAVYRMPFTAYNTWPGKAVERIMEAAEIALSTGQDMPVFWGMGDHGGGAARAELEEIRTLMQREKRVRIIHSSTEHYYRAIEQQIPAAPLHEDDLQRVCTGCYTSMARLKRRMQQNLGELTQTEAARTASWWLRGQAYPVAQLEDAWRDHLFNDFHDILPGSSIEAAEHDALDLYGRSSETHRRLRLGAIGGFAQGEPQIIQIPISVLNADPGGASLPVECEYMIDHMPIWDGIWHARLTTLDGVDVPVQEETAEMLLLPDQWRRKLCFSTPLPQVGAAHFRVDMHPGKSAATPAHPALPHAISATTGRINALSAGSIADIMTGEMLRALVVKDDADSWGMEVWNYKDVAGEFVPVADSACIVEAGPVRTIREAMYTFRESSIILRTIAYAAHPFIEFRLRIVWNEERHRLKLALPTRLKANSVMCEVPGGAIMRAADGEEHVQGRWMVLDGTVDGQAVALGVVNNGQHGFDCHDGEIRISVLRSAPYCYERTFVTGATPHRKVMDIGVHEVRLIVTTGTPAEVRSRVPSLANWLVAPPYALAHYPIGRETPSRQELLTLTPASVRLLACKQSWDGAALIVRIQETTGKLVSGVLVLSTPHGEIRFTCKPFEIKTYRIEKEGKWCEAAMIEET